MSSISKKEILKRTIRALESSYARHQQNEKILHQLAQAYAQAGCFHPRAVEVYHAAADKYPADMKIQKALSIAFLITQAADLVQELRSVEELDRGSVDRTVATLRQLAQAHPDSPEIHRALGDMQLLAGDDRDALQHYRISLALGLEDLEPLCNQFERIRVTKQLSAPVVVFFAEIYQRAGLDDRAGDLYRQLLADHAEDPLALEAYRAFLERRLDALGNDPAAAGEAARQLIRVTIQLHREQEALTWARQLATEVVTADPGLVRELVRILIDLQDFRQAFDYLSKVPLESETRTLLNEISVRLEKRGEVDSALYILRYISETEATQVKSQVVEAEREHRVRQQREVDIQTELSLAELHWKNKRWHMALERYLKALELGYDDYRSILEPLDLLLARLRDVEAKDLVFLANFFADRKDWRRVIQYSERVLGMDPSLSNIVQRMMQACEQILAADPDACDIRLRLGDLNLERNNLERALQEYRKAAANPEFNLKANRRIAIALARGGDSSSALAKYRELSVLDAEDLERLFDLMLVFAKNSNFKEAVEAGQLIVEYDKNFRDVAAKLKSYEERVQASGSEFAIDPKMRELIGDHAIGRYKYMKKVGSGGMGVVHKVADLKTGQMLAMKILREGLSNSGRAIDRFFREARIASTLKHPNVVRIVDYNISNTAGQSYIAMEFVDGPSLREVIEQRFADSMEVSKDDVVQGLDWMSQLCDALDCTHKRGIIHRDIKPDNILLAPENVVKITDFGIVHIEEATFTPTGALIGTPRYMSPEQVHGGRIDGRSDIYAVGIIFYEMLIGSPPFISGDIAYQQVNVLPTRPVEICPSLPPAVDRIIMKCLEKNPADRYPDALELKKDLDEAFIRLGGDPERRRHADELSQQSAEVMSNPVNDAATIIQSHRHLKRGVEPQGPSVTGNRVTAQPSMTGGSGAAPEVPAARLPGAAAVGGARAPGLASAGGRAPVPRIDAREDVTAEKEPPRPPALPPKVPPPPKRVGIDTDMDL